MIPEPENTLEEVARRYFESERVVNHYFRNGHRVGLWKSEEILLTRTFAKEAHLLDLGCGTGRIAFGLEKLGYVNVSGADYSESMIQGARTIAEAIGSRVNFFQADARELPWEEESFEGIIFGFNGFFMIPGTAAREKALGEIHRVLKPGGYFVFTGHDRSLPSQASHWNQIASQWQAGTHSKNSLEFGDVVEDAGLGTMYIHSTALEDTAQLLGKGGFKRVETWSRRELANENSQVREFADECRFWKAKKTDLQ